MSVKPHFINHESREHEDSIETTFGVFWYVETRNVYRESRSRVTVSNDSKLYFNKIYVSRQKITCLRYVLLHYYTVLKVIRINNQDVIILSYNNTKVELDKYVTR